MIGDSVTVINSQESSLIFNIADDGIQKRNDITMNITIHIDLLLKERSILIQQKLSQSLLSKIYPTMNTKLFSSQKEWQTEAVRYYGFDLP